MRIFVAIGALLLLGVAPHADAQSFWFDPSRPGAGLALEVQGDVVAGLEIVRTSNGHAVTGSYAGRVVRELATDGAPFTTRIEDRAEVVLVPFDGSAPSTMTLTRSFGIGTAAIRVMRGDAMESYRPLAFGVVAGIDRWSGAWSFVRTHDDGATDAETFVFGPQRIELAGQASLVGASADGRAALLVHDAALGVAGGAYETRDGAVVAFALLGEVATGRAADGLWTDADATGAPVGPDRSLRLIELAEPRIVPATKSATSVAGPSLRLVRTAEAAWAAIGRQATAGVGTSSAVAHRSGDR